MSKTKNWIDKLTRHTEPCHHYAWRDIKDHAPEDERKDLAEWLRGQACLLRSDGDSGIYLGDFDRWVEQGKRTEQGADWD